MPVPPRAKAPEHCVYAIDECHYAILFARALTLIDNGAADPSVVESSASDMYPRGKVDRSSTTESRSEGTFLPREDWRQWGEILRRYQLHGLVAWLLEAGRPLAVLSAQLLHFGTPFLGRRAGQLAGLLESDEDASRLIQYLESGS
jgi:hypothetical protein